jgi:regulator of telomere elongation helicase 1
VDLKKAEKYHVVLNLANVFFPYQPYSQQIDIVAAIQKSINNQENALIESPTGTGKTLCLLVGALSSLVDAPFRKKVYYLTRTHSQISQVVTEFKKTVYNCHLNIVASR